MTAKVEDYGYTFCDIDDLLTGFMSISEPQVAHSIEWYYSWADVVIYQHSYPLSFCRTL